MKIKIEIDKSIAEDEIIIRTREMTEEILELENLLTSFMKKKLEIKFFKDDTEYFLKFEDILFFQTEVNLVYGHTKDDAYLVKHKLYELEEILPIYFIRISKSTIVNLKEISSLKRNLGSVSTITFYDSHKINYVSRHYYKIFKEKLEEIKL